MAVTFDPAVCRELPAPEDRLCDFGPLFNVAGEEYEIDPRLLAAVAYVETSFIQRYIDCTEASEAGALGLMQILPGTAAELGVDPCDPAEAILGAARYLRRHYDEFDTWELAAAAYNAGPQAVRDAGGRIPPIEETRDYVPKVMDAWDRYRQLFPHGPVGDCPGEPSGSTQRFDDGRSTRATLEMANAVIACFGRPHPIYCYDRRTEPDGSEGPFEHPRGRACDFMVTSGGVANPAERERGQAMAEWVAANAEELNVLYVIWYNKSWNPSDGYKDWEAWRDYGCGGCGASAGHYNHVHVSVKLMPGDPPSAHCPGTTACTE